MPGNRARPPGHLVDPPQDSLDVTLGILYNSVAKGDSRKRVTMMSDDSGLAHFKGLDTHRRALEAKAEPVSKVVDTTGAGDLYAAGVLFGLTRGYELEVCGRIGSIAAAEVISHYGARPETSLAQLVKQKLG